MEEKRFNCKMEDVPVIAGFVFASFEKDKADFVKYSPVFGDSFMTNARAKQTECYDIVRSVDVLKYQKAVKNQLEKGINDLRLELNKVEGYLKLANSSLDIQLPDFKLKAIRTAISDSNVEKIILEGRSLINSMKRNEPALQAKGLSADALISLTTLISEIEVLNTNHNSKKNERSRAADDSIKTFNELWDITGTILDAGRALYRGVDEVKLREYTLSNLLKRVHNTTGSATAETTPKTDTPA